MIENAAREPEITDLADLAQPHGRARSTAPASSTIEVEGVERLDPGRDTRSWATASKTGTLLMACGIAGRRGRRSSGARSTTSRRWCSKLARDGPADVLADARRSLGPRRRAAAAVDVATLPYPGLRHRLHAARRWRCSPTADGTAIVTENVFDNRLGFVDELDRMGADVRTRGSPRGRPRRRPPLGCAGAALGRAAGAALVLAGLAAEGETVVLDPYHVDRGYPDLAGHAAGARRRRPSGVGTRSVGDTRVSGQCRARPTHTSGSTRMHH